METVCVVFGCGSGRQIKWAVDTSQILADTEITIHIEHIFTGGDRNIQDTWLAHYATNYSILTAFTTELENVTQTKQDKNFNHDNLDVHYIHIYSLIKR